MESTLIFSAPGFESRTFVVTIAEGGTAEGPRVYLHSVAVGDLQATAFAAWTLTVEGRVRTPRTFTLRDATADPTGDATENQTFNAPSVVLACVTTDLRG